MEFTLYWQRERQQIVTSVEGVCNFLGSVLSQQKFRAMEGPALQPSGRPVLQPLDGSVLQFCVAAQFYLESKGKYILEV